MRAAKPTVREILRASKLVSSTNKRSEGKKRRGAWRLRGTPTRATVWALSESGPEQAGNRETR